MSADKPDMRDAYYGEQVGPLLPPEVAKFTGLGGWQPDPRKPEPELELEPKAGDVWVNDDEKTPDMLVISAADGSFDAVVSLPEELVAEMVGESEGVIATAELGDCQVASLVEKGFRLSFNVFDLLAGDLSALAAVLERFPEVFLLEVGQGEEKREVIGLPAGMHFYAVALGDRNGVRELDCIGPPGEEPMWGWSDSRAWRPEDGEHRFADFPTAVNAALKGDEDA